MQTGVKHTIKENKPYFLTLTVQGWVDVFTRQSYCDLIIDSLSYCMKEKGLNIYAYVIMSNHMHMVADCREPYQLKDTLRDFKKFTSKAIIAEISNGVESRRLWMLELFSAFAKEGKRHKAYKFWKTGSHAIPLNDAKRTWQKINYIHQNPVKAGLVKRAEDWRYSSMSNYIGEESVLEGIIAVRPHY